MGNIRVVIGPSTSDSHLGLRHLGYRVTGMTAILSQDQVRAHGRQVCSDNEVLRRHGHFLRGVTSVVEDIGPMPSRF